MAGNCGTMVSSGLYDQVVSNVDAMRSVGDGAVAGVTAFTSAITNFIEGYNVDLNYRVTENTAVLGTPFILPEKPEDPDITYTGYTFDRQLLLDDVEYIRTVEAPTFTKEAPILDPTGAPGPFDGRKPGDRPVLTDVRVPDEPDYTLPDDPVMHTITLPVLGDITLPTWDEVAPDDDFISIVENSFSYNEDEYTGYLMDDLVAKIREMLGGSTGLPDAIWNQIWDRARKNAQDASTAAVQQATEEFASRGFSAPGGALATQIQRARNKATDMDVEQFREIAIKEAELAVQQLNFAVTQGIALESAWMQFWTARAGRMLDAAKYMFQASIEIMNAHVAVYNVRAQVYQIKAQVHQSLIQAELAELEIFKAKIDAQKLIGEINMQNVEVYKARLQGVLAEIEVFKGQIAGVQAQVELDRARVEAFVASIQAYGEEVKAYIAEWQGYEAKISAQSKRVDAYAAEVQAFASRTQAYQYGVLADKTAVEAQISIENMKLEEFKTYLEEFKTKVGAEVSKVQAMSTLYDGQAKVYASEGSVQGAKVAADDRKYQLALDNVKFLNEAQFRAAERQMQSADFAFAKQIEANSAIMTTYGHLAQAAYASVNLGGSVAASTNDSSSCSTNYSYAY